MTRKGIGVGCRKAGRRTVGASRKLIASKVDGVDSRVNRRMAANILYLVQLHLSIKQDSVLIGIVR